VNGIRTVRGAWFRVARRHPSAPVSPATRLRAERDGVVSPEPWRRRKARTCVRFVLLAVALTTSLHAQNQGHRPLFPPKDLGLLEMPDRAAWQKPDQIMDALSVADGAQVADIGAGAGWFTIRLARQVGPLGRVYAVEVQATALEAIRRRVGREGLQNVRHILGSASDPNLPAGSLDAALIVDTYPEIGRAGSEHEDRALYLRTHARSRKPGGRIGVVNYKSGEGGPGPEKDQRVSSITVEADARAAGLRVLTRENLPFQYLLVLGR
jgi:predicted RNA methylase